MPAKVIMVIEDQYFFVWPILLAIKGSCCKSAETGSHDNQIIMFICWSGVSDAKFAIPGALMCDGIGAGVAPSQACQTRWIGRWFRRLGKGGQSAGKRTSNSRSRSIDKVSTVDVAHKGLNERLLLMGDIL